MSNFIVTGLEQDFIDKIEKIIKPLGEISKLRQANDHYQEVISSNSLLNLSKERNRKDAIILSCALGIMYFIFIISILSIYSNSLVNILAISISLALVAILINFAVYFKKREILRINNYNMAKMAEEQIFRINQRANEILDQYENDFQILPPDYQYSIAAEYIYKCFINQRASTISEAVNLFEEQLHRWKNENYNQQLVNIQYQQQCTMEAIRRNSAISAGASVINLFVALPVMYKNL